jgi:uncharacterized protein (UPF0276 family)
MNDIRIDSHLAGIGLRPPHYAAWLEAPPRVSFMEVHSENFFGDGGQPLAYLERFRADYAISTHGVGLSLGSAGGLDARHLAKLKRLVDRIEPALVSEHLCWVGVDGRFANDLLPLPYTEESLAVVVANIQRVQETLGRRILVENVSSYLEYASTHIAEWEFVREVAAKSGAGILLDINNIYVNAVNHGIDARASLAAIPGDLVGEIHLAGFQDAGDILIDTHGTPVCEAVWQLYRETIARIGPKPTLIEWDTDIPAPDVLMGEAEKANAILRECSHVA